MSDTIAMPLELLDTVNHGNGQPLCPGCVGGRLHPYKVTFGTNQMLTGMGWQFTDFLEGFVAVCVGNRDHRRAWAKRDPEVSSDDLGPEVPACGFSMPLTAGRWKVGG